ncbi:hypothetical protein EVAR_16224_1 [Eumeta japonica]|uniref:Uncharacterized protein n=1 Tax=Eumeta variegata TaxID=151549 RepID=A0A4C1U6F2_EUMVA|nr:hypothetical protein EVAR_16224_1 [Eumeta japonica]
MKVIDRRVEAPPRDKEGERPAREPMLRREPQRADLVGCLLLPQSRHERKQQRIQVTSKVELIELENKQIDFGAIFESNCEEVLFLVFVVYQLDNGVRVVDIYASVNRPKKRIQQHPDALLDDNGDNNKI